jgi:hypothetical protein
MRLIDADALDDEMYHKSFEVDDGRNVWNSGLWIRYKIFEEAIRDAPTVDAVPVIRCKDCKYYEDGDCWYRWDNDGQIYYQSVINQPNPNDYCSMAERKEE